MQPVPCRKDSPTWADVAVKRVGLVKTMHVFHHALLWGLATAWLGREPESVEEYAERAFISRAKAFRWQQEWREAFPDEMTPARFNKVTGNQERYEEILRRAGKNMRKAQLEVLPLLFEVGGTPRTPA
jgi:hypothetical protein